MKKKQPLKKNNNLSLKLEKRTVFGKKLKALRKKGLLPANIFGENFKSQAVELPYKEFFPVYKKAGETQIVYLQLGTEQIPILIQNIQKHPITNTLLHVDFRKIDLKKKIQTEVPVKFVGQSEAVTKNIGVLLTISESLNVEALPDSIPSFIEVDISSLKELNNEIKVKDLKVTGNYIFKDNQEKPIVRISPHKEEKIETQVVAPETVEVTTGKKEETPPEAEKTSPATPPAASQPPKITP